MVLFYLLTYLPTKTDHAKNDIHVAIALTWLNTAVYRLAILTASTQCTLSDTALFILFRSYLRALTKV